MTVRRIKWSGVFFWAVINSQGVQVGTFQDSQTAHWYADQCEQGAYALV